MNNSKQDSKPQGGNKSKIKDSIISQNEMVLYNNVDLNDMCSEKDRTDSFVPTIGINKVTELSGEIIQIPISEIQISEIHSKLYESDQKRDKIEQLKSSIKDVGQLQPIVIAVFMGQNYLLDGRLRLVAMKELQFETISVIISPSVNDGDTLDNLVLQYHIRKDLNTQEKLNEIIEILQIGRSKHNKYIGIDKRREMVSKKLGRGFSRSKVIELAEIIQYELKNNFGFNISKSILEGKIQLSKGTELVKAITKTDYNTTLETERAVIDGFLTKKYDLEKTVTLMYDATEKQKSNDDNCIKSLKEHAWNSDNYEIRFGDVFNVDLSDLCLDLVFTSPPYMLQRVYGDNSKLEVGVEKNVDDYIKNLVDVFEKCYAQLAETGSMFVNINDTWRQGFSLNVIEKLVVEMEKRGIRKVQMIHWEKPNPKPNGNSVHRFINKFEYIIHFAKTQNYIWNKIGKAKTNLKVQKGCNEVGSKTKSYSLPDVISASSNLLSENMISSIDGLTDFTNSIKNNPMTLKRVFEKGEDQHTATFNMLLPLIPMLSTIPKDRQAVVLDPFAGTSTTGETALALGHRFVGVELYEKNCKTSARILHEAEDKFKGINLMNELVETEIYTEYSVAA